MRFLLVHQNFPGQFRQLTPFLAARNHELVAICSHQRPIPQPSTVLRYVEPKKLHDAPLGSQLWHEGLARASSVAHLCQKLNDDGWIPDKVLGHTGWGETLGISSVWPGAKQILWPELWVQPQHGGYGIDPLRPFPTLSSYLEQIGRNSLTRAALADASAYVLPTKHQALSFPSEFHDSRMHVIHEGIDTKIARPNKNISLTVRGIQITHETPIVTFVNRNLERLRGFDVFMRSLPFILKSHPSVRILIVGDNDTGYGGESGDIPIKQRMLLELGSHLDNERIHFLGRIPYQHLISLLQLSWVHVYLTYPFVLGWSLLEAMSCGCPIVASTDMPVSEVIDHGVEGLLVPINSPESIAHSVLHLLRNPQLASDLGKRARQRALMYDQRLTVNALSALLET